MVKSFQKISFIKVDLLFKYSSEKKKFRKIRLIFDAKKWIWKYKFCKTLRRLLIILVGLTMKWFSEKMPIFNICRRGLMPNLIKKSWTVSNTHSHSMYNAWNSLLWRSILVSKEKWTLNFQLALSYLCIQINPFWQQNFESCVT